MLEGSIIDVAIGLIFFYVLLSLICSAIQELVASAFGLRARNLKKGLQNLLGCHADEVYGHVLIKNLARRGKDPSYVRSATFATALLDVVARNKDENRVGVLSTDQVHAALDSMDRKDEVGQVLLALSGGNDQSLDAMRKAVAEWYDEAMDRVGGWYKRRVQWILLIIATVVTVGVNADTLHIAEQLWDDDVLRAVAVKAAEAYASEDAKQETLKELRASLATFPIWYPEGFSVRSLEWSMIVGWLLTIGAISLGAPFWFDLLGKVSHLRGSGGREADRAKKRDPVPPAVPQQTAGG